MDATQRRNAVRDRYARAATTGDGCCGPVDCCAPSNGATATAVAEEISCAVGYDESELKSVPDGANLGLGCGNPVALASLSPGESWNRTEAASGLRAGPELAAALVSVCPK